MVSNKADDSQMLFGFSLAHLKSWTIFQCVGVTSNKLITLWKNTMLYSWIIYYRCAWLLPMIWINVKSAGYPECPSFFEDLMLFTLVHKIFIASIQVMCILRNFCLLIAKNHPSSCSELGSRVHFSCLLSCSGSLNALQLIKDVLWLY